MTEIMPLLVRPLLLPEETLHSYMHRIAQANHLSIGHLLALIKSHLDEVDTHYMPTKPKTYVVLSKFFGLETYKIYWGTEHSFRALINNPNDVVEEVTLESGFSFPKMRQRANIARKQHYAQFCPYCLQASPYQRRPWLLQRVTACIDHRCLLIDECPNCSARLSVTDIMNVKCQKCDYPISETEPIDISKDRKGLSYQMLLYFWINSGPHIDLPLLKESKQTLYAMVLSIIDKITSTGYAFDNIHQIPGRSKPLMEERSVTQSVEFNYAAWTSAVDTLTNWPTKFHKFVDLCVEQRGRPVSPTTMSQMAKWLGRWLQQWPKEHHPALYPGIEECVYLHCTWRTLPRRELMYPPSGNEMTVDHPMVTKFKWIGIKSAREFLKMEDALLSLMINHKLVRGTNSEDEAYPNYDMLLCEDVIRLKKGWGEYVSCKQVSVILGISEDFCLKLIEAKVLTGKKGLSADDKDSWFVELESINQLLETFLKHSRKTAFETSSKSFCTVAQAERLLTPYKYDAVKLFKLAANGKLKAHYRKGMSNNTRKCTGHQHP